MERFRNLFRRFAVQDAPKADELLNLCMKKIQTLSADDDGTGDYLMNNHQCKFLVQRLTETEGSLQDIRLSPLLNEKTIPVLEELHQVLLDVETVIQASRVTSSQWPRAAIEQSDMKETFARLLYRVEWHVSVLQSILVDNSQESFITFEPASCDGQLSVGDELRLLTAMKEDEESLKDRLRSAKLDDPTEKWLADKLLKLKERSEELNHPNTSRQLPVGALKDSGSSLVSDESTGFNLDTSSPDMLFLNPQDLDLNGHQIGKGSSAEVKRMNLIGGEYAIKIFGRVYARAFDDERKALQRLGHHPHIVRILCYSKEDAECYLIMEKMDKDLDSFLSMVKRDRKKNNLTPTGPLSDLQAVALMLGIGEGVKYIHSKGMAHRDLKSGNVLVNLENPSSKRISSVKIADFGLTKTKNATQTYSNQTYNRGTSLWMAPEVIQGDDPETHSKFNPRKADVYAFAIVCSEVLTGEYPYYDHPDLIQKPKQMKEQVKAGTLRPTLPKKCPPRLAALIERCWHPIPHERPLFPEICKELRYIKGLLLKGELLSMNGTHQSQVWCVNIVECGNNSNSISIVSNFYEVLVSSDSPCKCFVGDQGRLNVRDVRPLGSLERAQIQGPWGGVSGRQFFDVGTSINGMKLRYSQSPGQVALMEVDYALAGNNFIKQIGNANSWGDQNKDIKFEHYEFITHISGYVSPKLVYLVRGGERVAIDVVVSLTIHSNIKSYGPFGNEEGKPFSSGKGRVIGFHGRCGHTLDSIGVAIILDDTS